MSSVPIEYWVPGSALLTLATMGVASLLPTHAPLVDSIATGSFFFWLILWAYSPLPQGAHVPGHKRRKRVWGFSVEYEDQDSPQKTLTEYTNDQ